MANSVLVKICFVLLPLALCANWNPEYLMSRGKLSAEFSKDLQLDEFKEYKQSIKEAIKNGWCSPEKADLIMDFICLERPEVSVEVGVFSGYSFIPLVATLKFFNGGKAHAIDAWSNEKAIENIDTKDPNWWWWSTVDMAAVKKEFEERICSMQLEPFCKIVPLPSAEAAPHFNNQTIDFLHLDGNFSEENAIQDVRDYLPKVKIGGYILFSNLFLIVNSVPTKMASFEILLDTCEIICEIEHNNVVLLRKVRDL